MSKILEKIRLHWWKRGFKIIWDGFHLQNDNNIASSTKTENDAFSLAKFISDNLPMERCKLILDIGCGNGNLGRKIFKGSDILIQADYIFSALKLSTDSNELPKRYILQTTADRLPFKNNTFDCIILYSVIHHAGSVANARKWLISLISLLKDGGVLYAGDVPLRAKVFDELKHRAKTIGSFNDIKYLFAELMLVSFSPADFMNLDGIEEVKIIPEPEYLKFNKTRVDMRIKKRLPVLHNQ